MLIHFWLYIVSVYTHNLLWPSAEMTIIYLLWIGILSGVYCIVYVVTTKAWSNMNLSCICDPAYKTQANVATFNYKI